MNPIHSSLGDISLVMVSWQSCWWILPSWNNVCGSVRVCFSGGPYKQERVLYRLICKEMCFVTCLSQTPGCWPISEGFNSRDPQLERFLTTERVTTEGIGETWSYKAEWIIYSLPRRLKCVQSYYKQHTEITTRRSWIKYQSLQNRALGKPLA